MELNKLCRTCLSATEDMQSLYETCATSTQICCAEILSSFMPLFCCKDDGLPTMICHNCIREINRFHTFRLKCLQSDGVLRKHVEEVTKVAGTNITVTNQRIQDSIKLEENMYEDSCVFEEVSIKNEFPTSSEKEISAKSLNDPLTIAKMQEDKQNQVLDIVKHEVDVDIKIEVDEHVNFDVNNAAANEQEQKKPYPCPMCNNSYKQKQTLTIHMRTHTEEKPYPCTVCDSSFNTNQQLTTHMRIHTGDQPYTCTVCNKSCRQRENLMSHMRTHTGEKPYTCTVCNNSYRLRDQLRMHMRTHVGEKPYPCALCERSFKCKRSLTIHKRKHTGEIS